MNECSLILYQAMCLVRDCLWKDGKCLDSTGIANATSILTDVATEGSSSEIDWTLVIVVSLLVVIVCGCTCFCLCHFTWLRVTFDELPARIRRASSSGRTRSEETYSSVPASSSHEYAYVTDHPGPDPGQERVKRIFGPQPLPPSQQATKRSGGFPQRRPAPPPPAAFSTSSGSQSSSTVAASVSPPHHHPRRFVRPVSAPRDSSGPQSFDRAPMRVDIPQSHCAQMQEVAGASCEASSGAQSPVMAAAQTVILSSPDQTVSYYPDPECSGCENDSLDSQPGSNSTIWEGKCAIDDASSSQMSARSFRTMKGPNSDASRSPSCASHVNEDFASSTDLSVVEQQQILVDESATSMPVFKRVNASLNTIPGTPSSLQLPSLHEATFRPPAASTPRGRSVQAQGEPQQQHSVQEKQVNQGQEEMQEDEQKQHQEEEHGLQEQEQQQQEQEEQQQEQQHEMPGTSRRADTPMPPLPGKRTKEPLPPREVIPRKAKAENMYGEKKEPLQKKGKKGKK